MCDWKIENMQRKLYYSVLRKLEHNTKCCSTAIDFKSIILKIKSLNKTQLRKKKKLFITQMQKIALRV